MSNLNSPRYIKTLLESTQKRLTKRMGQNFMISPHAVDLLIRSSHLQSDDVVIEIGPGLGVVTQKLLLSCQGVFAIEKDPTLAKLLLSEVKEKSKRLHLIQEDFLKVNLKEIFKKAQKKLGPKGHLRLISNLPYSITTPAIAKVMESKLPFESMTVTMQKEVGTRLVAKPGTKDYAAISVFVQYHAHPAIVGKINPGAFFPQPKVYSVVVDFQFYSDPPVEVALPELFFKIVRTGFSKRRKMLRHSLRDLPFSQEKQSEAFQLSGISETRRPESLSLGEFAALTNALSK